MPTSAYASSAAVSAASRCSGTPHRRPLKVLDCRHASGEKVHGAAHGVEVGIHHRWPVLAGDPQCERRPPRAAWGESDIV
jgi:hypothetical protein